MSNLLKKSWKDENKKMSSAVIDRERRMKIKELKRAKSSDKKKVVAELKENKRVYHEAKRKREEEKKSGKKKAQKAKR